MPTTPTTLVWFRDDLRLRDNAALNLEKQQLWDSMGRLNQYIYIAERLDSRLAARIAEIELNDPAEADAEVFVDAAQEHRAVRLHLLAHDQLNAYDVVVADDVVFSVKALDAFVAEYGLDGL